MILPHGISSRIANRMLPDYRTLHSDRSIPQGVRNAALTLNSMIEYAVNNNQMIGPLDHRTRGHPLLQRLANAISTADSATIDQPRHRRGAYWGTCTEGHEFPLTATGANTDSNPPEYYCTYCNIYRPATIRFIPEDTDD